MRFVKRIAMSTTIVVSLLSSSAIAFSQECKVAVVNMQEAIVGSSEGRTQMARFDARVKEWMQKIDLIRKEILDADRKLKAQDGRKPSQAQTDELNRAISEKNSELVQTTTAAQKDVDAYRDSLLNPMKSSAMEIAKQVAAEKGADSIVDSSGLMPPPSSPIPVGGAKCDITSEVKERMNAKAAAAEPGK